MNHVANALRRATQRVEKARATRPLERKLRWRGLDLSIEQDVGSVRRGVDPDGTPWETRMRAPYGYVRGTEGADGDHLDVFLHPELDGDGDPGCVYVIHIRDIKTGDYDEDKCFVGFRSEAEALECFAEHYDKPEQFFGGITAMSTADFVAHCKAGREKWGEALNPAARLLVRLHNRERMRKESALSEHRQWLKAFAANAGRHADDEWELDFDEHGEVSKATPVVAAEERQVADLARAFSVGKAAALPDEGGRRLLLIEPSAYAVDIQREFFDLELLVQSWSYYAASGNVDLEHVSKRGGNSMAERQRGLFLAGFEPDGKFARMQYEIGRPVADSLVVERDESGRITRLTYVAEIYQGNEAADWFWKTLTEQTPAIPWRPSIGGSMSKPIKTYSRVRDERLGIDRVEEVGVARDFLWNNVAMTLEPVNHWVNVVAQATAADLRKHNVMKGVDMTAHNTTTAQDVVRKAMLQAASAAIQGMTDADELGAAEAAGLTEQVAKAVLSVEAGDVPVAKGLDYGAVTSDAALLTQGGAMMASGFGGPITDYRKRKLAEDLYEDTKKGISPVSKAMGYAPSEDGVLMDVADVFMQEHGIGSLDALDCAVNFLNILTSRGL